MTPVRVPADRVTLMGSLTALLEDSRQTTRLSHEIDLPAKVNENPTFLSRRSISYT